jgi:hypothetical protein
MGIYGVGTKTSKNGVIFFTIFIPFLALCGPQLLQQISESFCHLQSYFLSEKEGNMQNKKDLITKALKNRHC